MPDILEQLAEAKIRDWRRRVDAGEATAAQYDGLTFESLESQLFREIVALRRAALELPPGPSRADIERRANDLRLQLMVGLEQDRPRLARILDAKLWTACRPDDSA